VAVAVRVPSLVGQSIPKYGIPRITLPGGTSAVYWSIAVFSLNIELVRGDDEEPAAWRFSWYAMTKNPSTAGARARML
jgi:hypothetical protein